MCGIILLIGQEVHQSTATNTLSNLIDHRGPDYSSSFIDYSARCSLKLKFKASILHLRGETLTKQPIIDKHGNVLLFNGQIYKFRGQELEVVSSDTSFLASKLESCNSRDDVVKILGLIDGPFAIVFWHNRTNSLFYARDLFGRKSLCKFTDNKSYPIILSSVCDQDLLIDDHEKSLSWSEVQSCCVHCMVFDDHATIVDEYIYPFNIEHIYPATSKCEPATTGLAKVMPSFSISSLLKPLNKEIQSKCNYSTDLTLLYETLYTKLKSAVSMRINYNWSKCLNCRQISSPTCCHSKLAVAFSGGIDSTLLALIIDRVYAKGESIDLITVAFKDNSPDRLSAAIAFKELRQLCPDRIWRLISCDISLTRLQDRRKQVIRHLIAPCNTVIDDSVGCACWFIGEGRGRLIQNHTETDVDKFLKFHTIDDEISSVECEYVSPATMLFVGSGIDEQLGGYSSHRSAWINSKEKGVLEEISFLMRRISTRNMGRDDRVYSHHGRDVKIPFLDFELVSFFNQLPLALKMNLEESEESGPKKLLRSLAFYLGLIKTSKQKKRALQFGTRIANLEDSKEKGNQICSRLLKLNSQQTSM